MFVLARGRLKAGKEVAGWTVGPTFGAFSNHQTVSDRVLAEKLASNVRKDFTRLPHETLSDREYEIMCLIASGKTVTEIAGDLSLSVKTISTYRTRVLEKLGVKNSAAIVQYAVRNGLVI